MRWTHRTFSALVPWCDCLPPRSSTTGPGEICPCRRSRRRIDHAPRWTRSAGSPPPAKSSPRAAVDVVPSWTTVGSSTCGSVARRNSEPPTMMRRRCRRCCGGGRWHRSPGDEGEMMPAAGLVVSLGGSCCDRGGGIAATRSVLRIGSSWWGSVLRWTINPSSSREPDGRRSRSQSPFWYPRWLEVVIIIVGGRPMPKYLIVVDAKLP